MHKLISVICSITLLVMLSCDDEDSCPTQVCDVEDPVTNLPWLADRIALAELMPEFYAEISMYKYNGDYVFLQIQAENVIDGQDLVFDCEGNQICRFRGLAGENTCPDFFEEATFKEKLWPFTD